MMKKLRWLFMCLFLISLVLTGCGKESEEATRVTVDEPAEAVAEPAAETPVVEPAESGGNVITAVCDPWPPFVDPDSPGQGISIEIVRAAFEVEGYDVKLEIMPWARAEEGVKIGQYDILPNVWYTDTRSEYLLYGDAYAANEVKFITLKGDSFNYNGLESLKGKTVGVVRDYGYGDEFSNSTLFTREESDEFIQNIDKLIAKRIDLALEDQIVGSSVMNKKDPSLLDQVEFTKTGLGSNPLHIASGKSNPRSQEIIDAYNKGLETIKGNGVYDGIMAKYGIQ